MIKALVFDMDGLMFDTERLASKIWQDVANEMKFPLTYEQSLLFKGANNEYKRKLFKDWYGDTVNYEEAQSKRDLFLHNYINKNGVPIKKGLFNLLNAMKEKNIKMAVATSTSRKKAEELFMLAGISSYIDVSICGDEVKKSKPDPEIFLKAINKLGFKPEECIILEDSPKGIEAAKNANGIVVMIPDTIMPTQIEKERANYIFSSLDDVINIL